MLNPDVFCRDITIFVKISVPYNALKGNNSKKTLRAGNISIYIRTGR
jgi:hypothetical protein